MDRNELIGRIYAARRKVEQACDRACEPDREEFNIPALKMVKEQKLYLFNVLDSLTEIMDDICDGE